MYKIVLSILVVAVVVAAWAPPTEGTVAVEKEGTSTTVNLTAAALATADVITIFGNAAALSRREPHKATAVVGIFAGVGSIALGGYVASADRNDALGILLGIAGGISLGLGAFGARLPEPTERYGLVDVRIGPTLIQEGDQSLWSLGLSGRF
jgi:hypothetical protein